MLLCHHVQSLQPHQGPSCHFLEFTRAAIDRTGNLPPMPGIFPDYEALVVQNTQAGHELVMMRWGPPSSRR